MRGGGGNRIQPHVPKQTAIEYVPFFIIAFTFILKDVQMFRQSVRMTKCSVDCPVCMPTTIPLCGRGNVYFFIWV